MFFKKRKEAQKQQRDNTRSKTETTFAKNIDDASRIEDPVRKILKLQDARRSIDIVVATEQAIITKKSLNADSKASIGGSSAALAAIGVSILVPPVLIASGPLMIGGMIAGSRRKKTVRKKLESDVKNHLQGLQELRTHINETMETTVRENVKVISNSPFYEEAMNVPGIAGIFADAAAKELSTPETTPAQKAEKKETPEADAAARKKLQANYDRLKGFNG